MVDWKHFIDFFHETEKNALMICWFDQKKWVKEKNQAFLHSFNYGLITTLDYKQDLSFLDKNKPLI